MSTVNDVLRAIGELPVIQLRDVGREMKLLYGEGAEFILGEIKKGTASTQLPKMAKLRINTSRNHDKITCIKTIRTYTDMGLRDAKESVESGEFVCQTFEGKAYAFMTEMINLGCEAEIIGE